VLNETIKQSKKDAKPKKKKKTKEALKQEKQMRKSGNLKMVRCVYFSF